MLSTELNAILDEIQAILLSFLIKLGPFAVALMPALFTAYAIFHTFESEAGRDLALAFAVVVGLAMETVGIIATHTSVDLYNGWQSGAVKPLKFWLMLALVPFYVLGVAGVVYFSGDAFTSLVRSLGIASPFLTCVVYVAVALARDLSKIERQTEVHEQSQQETERRKLDHELTMELQRMKFDHEKELRDAELKTEVQIRRAELSAEQKRTKTESAEPLRTITEGNEKAAEYNELLGKVRELSGGNSFRADELQEWLNRQKTATYDLIKYGRETGIIHQVGHGRYIMNGRN